MEDVQSWIVGWTNSCGFSNTEPPAPPDSAPGLVAPIDPSFMTRKLKQLAGEGLTVEVAAYLDRLGIAVPHGGGPIRAALGAAVKNGHVLTTHLLCKWHGGSLCDPLEAEQMCDTPLIAAVQGNHLALVKYLLQRRVPVDSTNRGGWAALHCAAAAGNEAIVSQLLDYGANPVTEVFHESNGELELSEIQAPKITALKLAQDAGHHHAAHLLRGAELPSDPIVLCIQRHAGWAFDLFSVMCVSPEQSVARGVVYYFGTMAVFCLVSAEVAIGFGVGWYLLSRVCHSHTARVPKALQQQGKEPLGVLLAALFVAYGLWCTVLRTQLQYAVVHWVFWGCSVLMLGSLLHCSRGDPGYTETGTRQGEESFLEMLQDGDVQPSRFCASCECLRPEHSKHCASCGRCVRDFDHHCPGIGNCVGQANRWTFVLFLGSLVTAQAIFLAAALSYLWNETLIHIQHSQTDSILLDSWRRLTFVTEHDKAIVFECVFQGLCSLVLLGLFCFHVYLIARGLTTNDFINWRKYGMTDSDGQFFNARDLGVRSNCSAFWFFRQTSFGRHRHETSPRCLTGLEGCEAHGLSHARALADSTFSLDLDSECEDKGERALSRQGSCRKIHRRSQSLEGDVMLPV